MRNKKGMSIGTVFIFMIAVITFAVIMIFGYKAIADFMVSGEKVEFYQFKTDLESSVKKIYTEYGSVRVEPFYLPARYKQICFVDLDATPNLALSGEDLIAYDVWETAAMGVDTEASGYDKADQNVFLKPLPPADSPVIKVYKIELEGSYLCLDVVGGKFKLRLEGRGDRTKLSEVLKID